MKSFQKVIAAVATCAALGNSAIVPASAQEVSAKATQSVEFTSDSVPFSKPYTPLPVTKSEKNAAPVMLNAPVVPPQGDSVPETSAPLELDAAQSRPAPRPQLHEPTRISIDESSSDRLPVAMETSPTKSEAGYTVTLTIPKSVHSIEVAANGQTESGQSFKLQLGSADLALLDSSERSNVNLHRRSQPTAQLNRHLAPESALRSGDSQQAGFQRNPYFQSSNHRASVPMLAPANPIKTSTATTGLHPTLASYERPERDLTPPIAIDQMQLELTGPAVMGIEQNADFSIYLKNEAADEMRNINVVLQYAPGLEIIVLDREAAVDLDNRQIQWTIPKLAAGQVERIEYRAKSVSVGSQAQQVNIVGQPAVRPCRIDTVIQAEFDTVDAPMLPFESVKR